MNRRVGRSLVLMPWSAGQPGQLAALGEPAVDQIRLAAPGLKRYLGGLVMLCIGRPEPR
jgi:hypothetical protein